MMTRRTFSQSSAAALLAAHTKSALSAEDREYFAPLRNKALNIGAVVFPGMDQIDFTGPFAVLSRLPDSLIHVMSQEGGPIRDHKGLLLTAEKTFANVPKLDVLHIPGGPGQESLMESEWLLSQIRRHVESGGVLFSVCTGALICGAAGVLRGRRATTHWSALQLLAEFGATPVNSRVVVDGNVITAAGVTAGIDGALLLTSLIRSRTVAEEIQLDIQYAPEPPFKAGTPNKRPPMSSLP